jgi:serine/threonine protein phosphatase PrpC
MLTWQMVTKSGTREHNEDCALCLPQGGRHCFVVADGLGGHGKGEVASALAARAFETLFEADVTDGEAFLQEAFTRAQNSILAEQKAQNAPFEMKTTCVALTVIDGVCHWGHIGDSRLYAFEKNRVRVRTLDHSVPQMLALSGNIREKSIRKHPDRNRLLRVMGVEWDSPRYELAGECRLSENQAFLLCTDGFWELIDEKKMGALLKKSPSASAWLNGMLAEVEKNGAGRAMDNYTAIAIMC